MIRLGAPVDLVDPAPSQAAWAAMVRRRKGQPRTRLQAIAGTVGARFQAYLAAQGDFTQFAASTWRHNDGAVGTDLYECYRSGQSIDAAVVTSARSVQVGYCPYCGIRLGRKAFDRKDPCDHHLPRSVFPEFSVFAPNLVTACSSCNDTKNDDYQSPAGTRLFLHPYFDDCLREQLVAATVEPVDGGTPLVRFHVVFPTRRAEAPLVYAHIAKLDVLAQLENEATAQLQAHLKVCDEDAARAARALRAAAQSDLAGRPNDPVAHAQLAASESPYLAEMIVACRR